MPVSIDEVESRIVRYHGKYRGMVINNVDPMQMGRIQVMVPDVSNIAISSWAMPCFPVAGIQMGIYAVPPIGAGVWVEFEQGDPDFPIWVGCFHGSSAEVPTLARVVPPAIDGITLQTTLQNGISINDVPGPTGGIMIKSATGASIMVNDTGITIQNGRGASIVMTGPTITINQGALVIT
ncbi:MAG: baseplate assembly protein [Puniceicoccaceae bacterium]|nr:MAG: baseplate assembly protein [Puniceicoccaceae bacterium]